MWLYHEVQVGSLCGVHAMNALLQGQYFTELDLAHIARELDTLEREMLGGAQLGEGDHGNLDDSGMFSSQVLAKALELWQLAIIPFKSQAIREEAGFDPVEQTAFICNLQEHWYSLRRVDGQWWNLNSLLPAPEPLSDFYLAAYLDSLVDQGYTIYVVRGGFPAPQGPPAEVDGGGAGRWYTPEEARQATKDAATTRQRGKAQNALETALSRAAQQGGTLTLQPRKRAADDMIGSGGGAGAGGAGHDDPELAAALAASLADHYATSQEGPSGSQRPGGASAGAGPSGGAAAYGGVGGGGGGSWDEEEDPELAAALAASMEDHRAQQGGGGGGAGPSAALGVAAEPPAAAPAAAAAVEVPDEPEEGASGALTVALRLRDRVVSRRWRGTDTVDQLRAFASLQLGSGGGGGGGGGGSGGGRVVLATQFPRRVLEDGGAALADAGVEDRSVLNVSTA